MKRIIIGLLFATLVANANAFYNPGTGRWLSRDPIDKDEGGSLNSYSFCASSPIDVVDPLGAKILTYDELAGMIPSSRPAMGAPLIRCTWPLED